MASRIGFSKVQWTDNRLASKTIVKTGQETRRKPQQALGKTGPTQALALSI